MANQTHLPEWHFKGSSLHGGDSEFIEQQLNKIHNLAERNLIANQYSNVYWHAGNDYHNANPNQSHRCHGHARKTANLWLRNQVAEYQAKSGMTNSYFFSGKA